MCGIEKGALAVLVVLASVTGCQPETIHGELGRADFTWSFCGIQGCDRSPALATGASGRLEVSNASSLPAFDVSSTDSSILAFSIVASDQPHPAAIQVAAIARGTAKLVLVDRASGDVIDRLQLTVEDPSTIATFPPATGSSLPMMASPLRIDVSLHDTAGNALIAAGAITYAPDPGITIAPATGALDDAVLVSITAPGTAAMLLTSGSASARLQVVHIEPQEVARVAMAPFDPRVLSGPDDTTILAAQALLTDGSVIYNPQLSWTSSNPGCLRVEDPDPPLPDDDFSHIQIRVMGTGCTARITASVGSAASSIDVSMQ